MSTEARREVGEFLSEHLPADAPWKTCEHAWTFHLQPGLPSPIRSIGRCILCGHFNASDLAEQLEPLQQQVDQAQRFAVAFSSECAHLEAERDDLILRLERALTELSQVKDAAGEEQ